MRSFNISGQCIPGEHYMLPPEPRLPGARSLIEECYFFVVHAPRQTGKSTTLEALADNLNAEGTFAAIRFSCERARTASDEGVAEDRILEAIRQAAQYALPAEFRPPARWPAVGPGSRLIEGLTVWAEQCPVPLVLFFDEIDALVGKPLLNVLSQLQDGYTARRKRPFISSAVLCGLRDVRDYRLAEGKDPDRIGSASPFNILVKSMRIDNFTREQVTELYLQHTADTGQEFTPQACELAFEYSRGQPWLTNALAFEITHEMDIPITQQITSVHVDQAKERLILARATHLDSLAAKLNEDRVRKIVESLIAGDEVVGDQVAADPTYDDDVSYIRDLGLIGQDSPPTIANPIYREVIVRVLGSRAREYVQVDPRRFVLSDGRLDFRLVLEEFATWWKQYGEILVQREVYHEVAPQLIVMAFLTRIVNGGSFVDNEYGAGRGRVDILVRKPFTDADGKRALQREIVEVKVRRARRGDPLDDGLRQLDRYCDRLDLDTGTLLIFDRRPSTVKKPPNPAFTQEHTRTGRTITLLRL